MSAWPAGRHLAAIYDSFYRALGEGAPRASDDAAVVRLHEASRAFGELAMELRGEEDAADEPLVASLIERSLREDATGALTLYAVATVLGPRLLVTLRDYLEREPDPVRRGVMAHGLDLVVAEIWAASRVLADMSVPEDPAWSRAARDIADALDRAGMAESLGQRA